MGGLALERGERAAARSHFEQVMVATTGQENMASDVPEHFVHALGALGHLARDEGDYARARSLYEESLALRRKTGNQEALAMSLEDFAVLAGREQQFER